MAEVLRDPSSLVFVMSKEHEASERAKRVEARVLELEAKLRVEGDWRKEAVALLAKHGLTLAKLEVSETFAELASQTLSRPAGHGINCGCSVCLPPRYDKVFREGVVALNESDPKPRAHEVGIDRPWPPSDFVRRLADAADHLMLDHACDAHGYESVCAARDAARAWLDDWGECTVTERSSAYDAFLKICEMTEHDSPIYIIAAEAMSVLGCGQRTSETRRDWYDEAAQPLQALITTTGNLRSRLDRMPIASLGDRQTVNGFLGAIEEHVGRVARVLRDMHELTHCNANDDGSATACPFCGHARTVCAHCQKEPFAFDIGEPWKGSRLWRCELELAKARAKLAQCSEETVWQAADGAWGDDLDRKLPEDDAIMAVFPTRSGRHDLYREAMRLVGAKHSKGGLVAVVNWLLHRIHAVDNVAESTPPCPRCGGRGEPHRCRREPSTPES